MSFRIRILTLIPFAGLIAVAAVAAAGTGQPFKVSSTLDGKSALPHRIHWIGSTTLPQKQAKGVGFLLFIVAVESFLVVRSGHLSA